MADRWFRVNQVVVETARGESHQPEFAEQVDGFSGFRIAAAPVWVVRFYADSATLDDIASQPGGRELAGVDVEDFYEERAGSRKGIAALESTDGAWVNR